MIAGTSIGSWNAMFWLAGLVAEPPAETIDLEQWWSSISLRELLRPSFFFPGLTNYFLSARPWCRSFDTIFKSNAMVSSRLERHITEPDGEGAIHFYFTRSNVRRARLEVTTNHNLK